MKLIDSIVTQAAGIAAVRRDIHAHPELCFEEVRTADLVAAKLTEWGIPIHRGMGTTGVVGIVHGRDGGASGRAIGLRADMDALPMQEHNRFAHASQHAGKMHACGHDGHTAMLLAAAQHFAKHRHFDGTVYLIFQPAEEGGGGAREMIKDGLFSEFPMEAVFGMHNWPGLPTGSFAASAGPVMASTSEFKITIRGKGGHAALPHTGIDPVPVACQMVMGLQTIITRNKKPVDAGVISVTMIHTGEATNVVPDHAELQGTVRTFTYEVLDLIEKRMKEIAEHTCAAYGTACEFEFKRNYPPTVNHPAETAFAREVLAEIVGPERVLAQEPTMGAEDFAYMLQAKPGCYVFIANGDGAHREVGHGEGPCVLHNPNYDFNDDLIPLGATYWVRLAEKWLAQPRANGGAA
ncbi:MAG: amidohydrolase [Hydrogenophaga sp. SCN 70-13]|uniref:M20 aminoacylase family protein n=1 Tax=unclassified Hydrogenophaga TaxID=2610897 RepID=UPI00086E0AC6|nr:MULTISPECIES: M20 aminoacylase family protein [unclassified Hydrogenophaga]MBN9369939.1 amidohydrolase [Hydrogenophaga sp.]ODT30277.1 MAG: amidohydrolase [Hydrogenophaga sp. SCN 70-13]OJV62499.1 MAG: amidohydrolase [Hydrogenophaga sp. 70-12]